MHCDDGNARQKQVEDNKTALGPWLREERSGQHDRNYHWYYYLVALVLNNRQYYPDPRYWLVSNIVLQVV